MPPSSRTSSRLSANDEEEAANLPVEEDTTTKAETTKVKGARKSPTKANSKIKGKTAANKKRLTEAIEEESGGESSVASAKKATSKKRKENTTANEEDSDGPATKATKKKKKKASPKKRKQAAAKPEDAGSDGEADPPKTAKKKKKAKEPVQSITDRDELPKLWTDDKTKENSSYTFKIGSWNVAGLRALMRKDPDALAQLVTNHNLDVLCLQETKLQEMHVDDPKLKIRGHLLEEQGYDAYYSCSVAKKGYSGTAVFVKRRGNAKAKQTTLDSFFSAKKKEEETDAKATLPVDEKLLVPDKVTYELGKEKHDAEGRVICLEFPGFTMTNLYVPNSGQKLERLDYRTEEWDKDLVQFAKEKQEQRGRPVMWLGDLNVAHRDLEAYNFGAKHLDKQAGLTPQERESFQEQLDSGFVDAFRHLHPTAKGHYSYWSQRAGNREPNKGLRLDYFVCDPSFFKEDSKVIARDSYMIPEQLGSDHCPVVLELEMKP